MKRYGLLSHVIRVGGIVLLSGCEYRTDESTAERRSQPRPQQTSPGDARDASSPGPARSRDGFSLVVLATGSLHRDMELR